jgi:citrate lyase subunit beta/citryl-CoA lyase
MSDLFRSLVFVPGNNPRFLEKAKSLPADIVCFDLEDSVPDNEKKKARALIKNTLKQRKKYFADIFVRTNSQNQAWLKQILRRLYKKELMEL